MAQPRPIDRPISRRRAGGRTVEVQTVVIPSIPLVEARDQFLANLRWKTSRLSGKRITASTADKYRYWLRRFEKWLVENGLPLDLGGLTAEDFRQLQSDVLDDIDAGALQESSAATYARSIRTLFADTWEQLSLEALTNPARVLRAGSHQAVDFPLFQEEHVRSLMKATLRLRSPNIPPWIAYRDQAVLACFFDLGWRVGEAYRAELDDVDFKTGYVTIPRENVKNRYKGRSVGLNPETGRLLKNWVEKWRPSFPNRYLFVSLQGGPFTPLAIRRMFRRLARVGGISREAARVSPHTCRHYFAVQWARNHPGDLAGLQRVLGHSSIRTTQIYFERADDLGAVERQQMMPSNWR